MTQILAAAVALGAVLGAGLWCLVAALPRWRRPALADRVAPAVVDVSDAAAELVARRRADAVPVFGALLGPAAGRLRRAATSVLGGAEAIAGRLASAGSDLSVEEFRGRQLVWALGGLGAGILLVALASPLHRMPGVAHVAIPVLAAVLGFTLRDRLLQRASRRRRSRIVEEFPTVLEFLALCLSAGESIHDALGRVARTGRGEFAAELSEVTAQTRTGVPLATALGELDRRVDVPAVSRWCDAVIGALEHGAPLAGVLRAQAGDGRDEAKRMLLESGGRKEIGMMVPLVFLILPVTVLFAVYPGVFVLRTGL